MSHLSVTARVLFLLIAGTVLPFTLSGQTISAGPDTTICLGGSADLKATVISGSYGTSSYSFEIIPWAPEAFTGGTGVRFVPNQDDKIAGPFNIGFNFCFFNIDYTQFYIGSNGWVGFSYNNAWTTFTAQPIPNTNAFVPKNCIMAPWQDWWPGWVSNSNQTDTSVYYYVTGTAPYRKLVVYWIDCPLYNCRGDTSKNGTFQIVLNEQNSIVENHIKRKPNCSATENATQGVHNIDGTVAFTAVGRNCTPWTANYESTRFVPEGIRWFQGSYPGGPIVGYGTTITVSPTTTTSYIAAVEHCNGGTGLDTVVVFVIDAQFSFAPSVWCSDDPDPSPALLQAGGSFSASPGGLVFIDTVTGQIDLSASTPGSFTVTRTITTPCNVSFNQSVTINAAPATPVAVNANVVRCGPGSVTLSVVPVPGEIYNWYDMAAGGTLVGTGNSLTVVIPATTLYYAEAVITATGCHSLTRTLITATVNPIPSATAAPSSQVICNADSAVIFLTSVPPNASFTWTTSASTGFITGYSNGSGSVIRHKLFNSGNTTDTVYYTITPLLTGCTGNVIIANVAVRPVVTVSFTPPALTVCSGTLTNISINPSAAGSTVTWTCTASGPAVTGWMPGAGTLIQQTLANSGTNTGWVNYLVSPSNFGCPGIQNNITVTVNPLPAVTFTPCFDLIISRNARPVTLKGGVPVNGTYTGTGVAGGIFYPAIAGAGLHPITYSYTNMWGCSSNVSVTMDVRNSAAFACGSTLTDIRDNKTYPTVLLGGKCWMASNLNFGTFIPSSQMQRDNCITEKYCFNDLPANCGTQTLYQWDEIMHYTAVSGDRGICPSEWHIPTEAEWAALFSVYITNGFAGNPLKYSGYSGFNAFVSGVRFNNNIYTFNNFAVLFWSSDAHGPTKAWAHGMTDITPSVSYYPSHRNNAFGVRCIKD
jgi:uncharacterized protein (TIGR02145 family)